MRFKRMQPHRAAISLSDWVRTLGIWLLLVALAFSINIASHDNRAAVGSGFVNQKDNVNFAINSDPARFLSRAALVEMDGDDDFEWPPTTAQVTWVVFPDGIPRASTFHLPGYYRANLYQQAPRAPPFV